MEDASHRFAGVVWEEVIDRLMAEAIRLFASARLTGEDCVLRGLGLSPEDLVYQTVNAVLEDKTVRYRREDGDILPFLKKVMRNDFVDLVRRPVYQRTVIVDPIEEPKRKNDAQNKTTTLESLAPASCDPHPDTLWRERVRQLAGDDPKLVEYVDAVLELELTKPAAIAEILSTTAQDILQPTTKAGSAYREGARTNAALKNHGEETRRFIREGVQAR